MKLLILGASGLVGYALAQRARAAFPGDSPHVVGIVGRTSAPVPGLAEQHVLDLSDLPSLRSFVLGLRPDAILNAAAISEPYRCEADPSGSARINVEMPEELARCAVVLGSRLIHLSSEQVFRGDAAPYRITDRVDPINEYARQKVQSEERVHRAAPALATTLRVPLLTGNSFLQKRSVHERMLADWAAGKTPRLFTDEIRQSCSGDSVAEAMLRLCRRPELTGVFHWAGKEALSRYEQGRRIREHFSLSEKTAPLQPIARADDPAMARSRQANLALDLEPLSFQLGLTPETFAEQLSGMKVPDVLRPWFTEVSRG